MIELILTVHAFTTLFMVGLIWFVQVVHYPLFSRVGGEGFADYETLHSRRTTWVVAPAMLLELTTALLLLGWRPVGVDPWMPWAGLGLLAVIWLSTVFLQVSQHRVLAAGFDADAHRRLVRTNWIRTAAWSLRSGLVLWMMATAG